MFKKKDKINFYTATITSTIKDKYKEEKKYFYSYENGICRLLYQIEKNDNNNYSIVERGENQPILLRDFPLIGSEKFHFPFFIDGFKFNPLETRNGLYLNGNLNHEAIENREILTNAIKSSIEFTKYIIEQTNNKRYLLAKSNIPEPPQKYDNCAKEWFINQQKEWRKKLIEMNLLKDEDDSFNELKTLKLPQFNKKYNKDFYDLLKKINLTGGILPNKEDIEIWYDIMEKDPLKEVYEIEEDTWDFKYIFTEEDLFKKIEEYKTINEFANEYQKDTGEILVWLNELYKFLNKNNSFDCLNNYKMIPNQKGVFLNAHEIFGNNNKVEDKIPEIINQIYKEISKEGKEIYDIIVHKDIDIKNIDKSIEKKNLKDIFNEFSNFFKDKNNDIKKKQEYLCNEFISFDINNDKIKKMFNFRKETQPEYEKKQKEKLEYYCENHIIWKEVEEFWFDYHSKKVEEFQNIDNLSKQLFKDIKKEDAYNWINNYIEFLKNNSTLVEKKKIFPNKNGDFKYIKELRSGPDIPESLIDYQNELERIKKRYFDKRDSLLSNKIVSYNHYNRISQKEIISDFESLFNTAADDKETKLKVSEQIMTLVPKNESPKFQSIKEALNKITEYYNKIFNKNITKKEEDLTAELNYGIFVSFILDKIFKKIEKMNKTEITSNIELIPKIIQFAWDYQFDNYFRVNINPKNYKIFLDQDNILRSIEEIYIKNYYFGELKYSETDNKLVEIYKSKIIKENYKRIFLAQSFDKILEENYADNFRQLTLREMCEHIDEDISSYFDKKNISELKGKSPEDYLEYKKIFFDLNDIIKTKHNLRNYFPKFMEKRVIIGILFLENDEDEKDKIVDNIKIKVKNN